MRKQYIKNNLGGHKGNISLRAYNHRYRKGFVISSGNDDVAIYKEFGTGIVGYTNSNPLASNVGYEYNIKSPYKGYYTDEMIRQYVSTHPDKTEEEVRAEQTPNTWWYWKNGTWRYTEGMEGKDMYYSLVETLKENVSKEYKNTVKKAIGGKK